MRSFRSRRASEVNRSGGIHGMSRWQSAEILRYCMLFSRSRLSKRAASTVLLRSPGFVGKALSDPAFLRMRHEHGATRGLHSHAINVIDQFWSTESRNTCALLF